MEQDTQQPLQQPAQPQQEQARPERKGEEEFSIAWNLKILAVIYVILGVFYLILKVTLK